MLPCPNTLPVTAEEWRQYRACQQSWTPFARERPFRTARNRSSISLEVGVSTNRHLATPLCINSPQKSIVHTAAARATRLASQAGASSSNNSTQSWAPGIWLESVSQLGLPPHVFHGAFPVVQSASKY